MNGLLFVLDRFEEDFAVLENLIDGSVLSLRRETLPLEAQTGDVLEWDGVTYRIDVEYTSKRHEMIQNKVRNLWK